MSELFQKILSIQTENDFEDLAFEVYRHQLNKNKLYHDWVLELKGTSFTPGTIEEIPFLPIEFFKTHDVKTGDFEAELVFTSSGTTGSNTSRHLLSAPHFYEKSFTRAFSSFYGKDLCILGLLPSYLERSASSLVYMVDKLIETSPDSRSGFFLNEFYALSKLIDELEKEKRKTLLIGVTYALLDFFEQYPKNLRSTIVMETGGMKGRKKELTRAEVHEHLKSNTGLGQIHSEYGMTELLSQAYSRTNGLFECPTWMKVLIRKTESPQEFEETGETGGINVIDLANIESCSFIATQDLGRITSNSRFEVLGRFDNSDVRGCSLLST